MIVRLPNWLAQRLPGLFALLLLGACTRGFQPPADIQSLRILPATGDASNEQKLKPTDANWVMALLRGCQWTHPKHVVPEPAYRLVGANSSGVKTIFGIRGTQINVSTPDGAGRCKLKAIDAQRLSKLSPSA